MSTSGDVVKAHHSQKGMEMTYTTSPNADDLNGAIQQWVLTHVAPALIERGMLSPEAAAALLSVRSMDTPPLRRRAVAAQLAEATTWQDREVVWLIASVLDPRGWTLDPISLPDVLIARLGLRTLVALARADEVV